MRVRAQLWVQCHCLRHTGLLELTFFHRHLSKYIIYRNKTAYCTSVLSFLCRCSITDSAIQKLLSSPNRGLYALCLHATSLFAFATVYLNISCILPTGPFDCFPWTTWLQFTWFSLVTDNLLQICGNCLSGLYCSLQNCMLVASR